MVERVTSAKTITPEKALKNIAESDNHGHKQWRQDAYESFLIYNGYQWPDADLQAMRKENRPPTTFNRVAPLLDAVVGLELANRKEVKFYARTTERAILPDMMNSVAAWVRQESGQEIAELDAFRDMITCGIGVTNTHMNYADSEQGDMDVSRKNPLNFRWDWRASKRGLRDSRWRAVYEEYGTLDDVADLWPDKKDEIMSLNGISDSSNKGNATATGYPKSYSPKAYTKANDGEGYKVWEYQYFTLEPYYKVQNPFLSLEPQFLQFIMADLQGVFGVEIESEQMNLSPDGFKKLKTFAKDMNLGNIESARLNKRVFHKLFFIGNVELQHTKNAVNDFTLKVITGKRDEKDGCWYGIVRSVKDPQLWANKLFSTILYTFMKSSKGGIYAQQGAIEDLSEFKSEWANPGGVPVVNMIDGIKERPQPQIPPAAAEIMRYSIEAIPATTGISPEVIAMASQNRSAKLAETRIGQTATLLNDYFESMSQYRKEWGKMLVLFTREYLAQEDRLIRISDNGTAPQFIKLINDSLADDYDTITEEGALSISQKMEAWNVLTQLFQGQGVPTPLWKYAPVPPHIANELMEYFNQQEQSQAQQNQQITQLQGQQMMADIQKTQALAQNSAARTRKIDADIGKTMADTEKTQIESAMNYAGGTADALAFNNQVEDTNVQFNG